MSKISIYIFAFALGVVSCFPKAEEKLPGNPEYCEDWGIQIKKDETVVSVPGQCLKAECVNPDINELIFTICPKVSPESKNCHISKMDTTKPYPDCCPKSICKEPEKL